MRSPFIAIAEYERQLGLPTNYINTSMCVELLTHRTTRPRLFADASNVSFDPVLSTGRGPNGSWQKFERGEIALLPFYKAFGRDLSDIENGNKWLVPPIHTSAHASGLAFPHAPESYLLLCSMHRMFEQV
jgi:hypothetical protein